MNSRLGGMNTWSNRSCFSRSSALRKQHSWSRQVTRPSQLRGIVLCQARTPEVHFPGWTLASRVRVIRARVIAARVIGVRFAFWELGVDVFVEFIVEDFRVKQIAAEDFV